MYYNYYQHKPYKYDEFATKEIYSANPTLSSLQEVILIYLKETAYYLLKLKDLGASNEIIKEHIIEAISEIISNVDYNSTQFEKIIHILSQNLSQTKALYSSLCPKNNKKAVFLKQSFKPGKTFNITEIIKKGEMHFIKKNAAYTGNQKNLLDIMLILVKNICIKIIQLKSYNKNYDSAYYAILTLLNAMNTNHLKISELKSLIETCANEHLNLIKTLSDTEEKVYGKRESVYISFSPRKGKAILVSGIDLKLLESVLKATKNRGIDIYTHGMTMLMAHTLPKFRAFPNLAGHFTTGPESSLLDFITFPGAILTTRFLFQKIEHLYRGRLFTTDSFAPKGIIKINDNDFEPLIQSAISAKGFEKPQQHIIKRVGFKQNELDKKIDEILKKINKNQIKHLYIVGLLKAELSYKIYFDTFLELVPKDCYVLCLAYDKQEENILHVDSFYDYLFIYKVLEKINEKTSLNLLKLSIFITKCDQYTIANILNFINIGVKDIYLCKCAPNFINPALLSTLKKTFAINEFSTPKKDLEKTLRIERGKYV